LRRRYSLFLPRSYNFLAASSLLGVSSSRCHFLRCSRFDAANLARCFSNSSWHVVLSSLCWCLLTRMLSCRRYSFILQAVVDHVKHVSIDLSRRQQPLLLLRAVAWHSTCHRIVALADIPLQFIANSREANRACTCACSFRLLGATSSGAPSLGRHRRPRDTVQRVTHEGAVEARQPAKMTSFTGRIG
jgi:hypothetical protein